MIPKLITKDAEEFGIHVKQGGWRLGLLVARNVERGEAGRPAKNRNARDDFAKVSAQQFAKLSDTSAPRVLRYLDAWNAAADAGHVSASADLSPGDDVDLNVDELPDWNDFYPPGDTNYQRATPERRAAIDEAAEKYGAKPAQVARVAASAPAVAAAVHADRRVAEAAAKALATDDETYQTVRAARVQHLNAEANRSLPPPQASKNERIHRIEEIAEGVIARLGDELDEFSDLGKRLGLLEENLDALSDAYRQRLARALRELTARVSAWEDRMLGVTGYSVSTAHPEQTKRK